MSEQAADRTADQTPDHEASGSDEDVDQLLDKLGFEDTDPKGTLSKGSSDDAATLEAEPVAVVEQAVTKTPPSSRVWAAVAGVLALGLIAAIGAVIWLATSGDDTSEIATDDAVEVGTARGAVPELDAEADRLRGSLEALGLDGVEVAVRGSVLYVEGTVSTEEDVAAVYEAADSVADGILGDVSGLVSDASHGQEAGVETAEGGPPPQPGAAPQAGGAPPPPGAGPPPGGGPPPLGPPPNEPRIALQAELDRVLDTTPLVFESGQTELTDAQRAVLDTTVTSLLYTYPGIPIRIVGYTDEAGDDDANITLSIARADAVRQHLVLQGVPGFGMIAEGRGEVGASGDAALDRRVELEVVLLEEQVDGDGEDG
ncbi:MAG: OmpA family protein [Acidimicrobiales bacterium]